MNTINQRAKILVTGGHITPAVAVIDELARMMPIAMIVCVGRSTPFEGAQTPSEEAAIMASRNVRFIPLLAGRITRATTILSFIGAFRIPLGFFRAIAICLQERPDLILSFGGYIAVPIVVAGYLLRVPTITHEQTRVPGLGNRIIGMLAKRICVSFPETIGAFPYHKTVLTGLPIRRSLFHPPVTSPQGIPNARPILFITGGSTGAVSLNRLIYPIVTKLAKLATIVHQTGRFDYSSAKKFYDGLAKDVQKKYIITAYLDESAYAWVINAADLIVGRSGANTVGEIATIGKVALFIPLPWSAGNEQYHNALALERAGAATLMLQKNLTPDRLLLAIDGCIKHKKEYEVNAKRLADSTPKQGAQHVAREVAALLSHNA